MGYLITIPADKINADLTDFPLLVVINEDNFSPAEVAAIYADPLKVSFTLNSVDLYAEIESLSATEIRYWVKVFSVSSTINTNILFSFSLTSDNSAYVGIIGSTPGQAVWSNELGVWHGVQDPSGGSDAILDSTTNANHGTSIGTMTSDDLIDTVYGPALDFDGSDDYIDCGSPGYSSATGTLFALLNLSSTQSGGNYAGLITNSQRGWRMRHNGGNYPLIYASGDKGFDSSDANWNSYANEWHVYTILMDGSLASFFVDGVLLDSRNMTNSLNLSNLEIFRNGHDGHYLHGAGKNFIVSTEAWSADKIAAFSASLLNDLIIIESTMKVSGTIIDSSGSPLVGTVNIHNQSTGELIATTTANETTGEYSFDCLPAGTYYVVAFVDDYRALVFNDVVAVEMD